MDGTSHLVRYLEKNFLRVTIVISYFKIIRLIYNQKFCKRTGIESLRSFIVMTRIMYLHRNVRQEESTWLHNTYKVTIKLKNITPSDTQSYSSSSLHLVWNSVVQPELMNRDAKGHQVKEGSYPAIVCILLGDINIEKEPLEVSWGEWLHGQIRDYLNI